MAITLDERDRAVLAHLFRERATAETLAARTDTDRSDLRDRLPALADNGLVERAETVPGSEQVDATGSNQSEGEEITRAYALTDSGRRVLFASPAGSLDDRIDTPSTVEEAIASWDLRADRADAVRAAFAFLRYWGEASAGEIADAIFTEHPAGFESLDAWWDGIRDVLAALPPVESPGANDDQWRFEGTPIVAESTADGREVLWTDAAARSSAKLALERLDSTAAERAAVRAAFDSLVRAGELSGDDVRARIYPDRPAGYASAEQWWTECVEPAFERIPGAERSGADAGGEREQSAEATETDPEWRYRRTGEERAATDPDADPPAEQFRRRTED